MAKNWSIWAFEQQSYGPESVELLRRQVHLQIAKCGSLAVAVFFVSFVPDLIVAVTMFSDMQRGYNFETDSLWAVLCAVIATRDNPNNSWWPFAGAQQALVPIHCVLRFFKEFVACYGDGWIPTKADVNFSFLGGHSELLRPCFTQMAHRNRGFSHEKPPLIKGFSMTMLNNQMVYII